jgi:TfoX/Sxy family transcriptional regulator of competence genes
MEVGSGMLYRGMLGSGRKIWREDGIRGLYQGLGPMLLGYLPTWAVYLAVYDRTREYFYDQTGRYLQNGGQGHSLVLTIYRKLVVIPRLCFHHSRCMLNDCDEPHLGHQDQAHVTKP